MVFHSMGYEFYIYIKYIYIIFFNYLRKNNKKSNKQHLTKKGHLSLMNLYYRRVGSSISIKSLFIETAPLASSPVQNVRST